MRVRLIWLPILALSMAAAGFLVASPHLATRAATAAGDGCPLPIPDNLGYGGSCCVTATPNLPWPAFAENTQDCLYVTWNNCDLRKNDDRADITVGTPTPLDVDPLDGGGPFDLGEGMVAIPIDVTAGAQTGDVYSGELRGVYSRTWVEDTDGDNSYDTQAWRVLVNGDLQLGRIALRDNYRNNNNIPQCHHSYENTVYWFGYIDYRYDGSSIAVEIVLNHECDYYHHSETDPDSARPGTYHPRWSFAIVAPTSFVPYSENDFVILGNGLAQESQQTIRQIDIDEETRRTAYYRHVPVTSGLLEDREEICICGDNPDAQAQQFAYSRYRAVSDCFRAHRYIHEPGTPNPLRFVQKRMGYFTDAFDMPLKSVCFKMGDLGIATDACAVSTNEPEYFEGIQIIGGYPSASCVDSVFTLLADEFDDNTSSVDVFGARVVGAPHVGNIVISSNLEDG